MYSVYFYATNLLQMESLKKTCLEIYWKMYLINNNHFSDQLSEHPQLCFMRTIGDETENSVHIQCLQWSSVGLARLLSPSQCNMK